MVRESPDALPSARSVTVAVVGFLLVAVGVSAPGPVAVTDAGTDESSDERRADEGSDDQWAVVLDVRGEAPVTVTYATNADDRRQFTVRRVDPGLVDAESDWAYLPRSELPHRLTRADGNHTAGVATVGKWALVGDLAAASARVGRTQVTVVSPAGMDVDPGRKAHFLETFLSPYSFQPNASGEVTFLVGPDALPADGRMYDDTGYIAQHAFWDGDVTSVWIHEYVHAKREFTLTPAMRWFSEGSATYFSYRVLEEQYGPVTEADVRQRLSATSDYSGTALANRSAWRGSHADYHRGAKLLYVVDAKIRAASGGTHTLVDVFRAMHRHDGAVSVDDFVRIVERHSGENEDWLRTAITGTAGLDRRVEQASRVFDD